MSVKHENVFKELLVVDAVRGVHSTGMFSVSKYQDMPTMAKTVGTPYDLGETQSFAKAMQYMSKVLVGHNRFATQGKVTKYNAHPFEFDSVIGVHNGSLTNKNALLNGNLFEVDSQALYSHIDEEGIDDLVKKARGAMSLVWYNKDDKTLNFYRNKERPMFITSFDDDKCIAFASEAWMLSGILGRNGIVHSDIVSTDIDTLYTFSFDEKKHTIVKPHVRVINPPVVVAQTTTTVYPFVPRGKITSVSTKSPTVIRKVPSQREPSPCPFGYAGKKGVLVEVLVASVDEFKAGYLSCFDKLNPGRHIRIYLKPSDDAKKYIGKDLIVDIGDFYHEGRTQYYKGVYSTMRLAKPAWTYPTTDKGKEADSNDESERFPDHRGKLIDAYTWRKQYGDCSWCSGNVNPKHSHHLTPEGDAICQVCMNIDEVKDFIRS